ncbi:MAG: PPOX class F420-dependent oxidoreductase [Actinobacteria bacterium]|jgi:PPOX class probable F420-dependent enzyme|nr:PPOX class F420-dependent oxidoreductase [Actinomycetota bacterium]MCL6105435.1 PPOX class F420-dependent oxidoreductase [Actinomycetota bacterium]
MTREEIDEFIHEIHNMSLATIAADGRPHLVAMWYGFIGNELAFWTYRKSQKAVNLRRDPRLSCLIEGGLNYQQLKGVELVGTGVILEDPEIVREVGESVYRRYMGVLDDNGKEVVKRMGQKRVAVRIDVDHVVSWDHSKLADTSSA